MKIVGIFMVLCAISALSGASYGAQIHGFEFKPWQDCTRLEQCKVLEPKDWALSEQTFFKQSLNKLAASGLTSFLTTVRQKILTFERSKTWFTFGINPFNPDYKPDDRIQAMTLPDNVKTIVFTDQFFTEERDPLTQTPLTEITLLHELAHAYDEIKGLSSKKEFYEAAGFKNAHEEFYLPIYNISNEELDSFENQKTYLNQEDAAILDRRFAITKGLPRTYSMINPAEAFADLVAFIYFDPNSAQYVKPALLQYIDTNVLNGSRDYSR